MDRKAWPSRAQAERIDSNMHSKEASGLIGWGSDPLVRDIDAGTATLTRAHRIPGSWSSPHSPTGPTRDIDAPHHLPAQRITLSRVVPLRNVTLWPARTPALVSVRTLGALERAG
jgi:hypothetical protein